ncbi:branched-chain amino acid transport system permease protein [Bradyrhizobium erythrophlei]|uniref:Branched-chain amino acid transport system permease protein n=2 Tax=Bradyrhizobium erythrophlei TaxID=1437360 RepID=A0A1M5L159_9BRAD|nr:branched-chain amino acid transport system permease protein [Bradyrhizobium erythrophlei]
MLDSGSVKELQPKAALTGLQRPMLRIAIAALLAASLVIAGPWVLDTYTVNILVRAFFVALAALTVDVLWGVSGTLTFGQSAFFGIGGYALAIVFTQFGFGPGEALLALGAAVGVAAIVAGLVGWLSFYPGSTPLYASVISLVLPIVLVQILYSGGTFTGSSSGLVGFESFDVTLENWFRLSGLAVISALVVTWIVLRSDAGRVLGAMRDNDERCSYLGIDTARVRIGLLVVAAIVAALAGFGYVGFGAVAAPENAGFVFGTQLVVMVALGGRGSLIGAVIGAVVIEVASAYLSSSFPFVWELIVGIAFVMVIVLLPGGLLGGLRDLVRGIRRRIRPAPAIAAAPVLLATLEHAGVAPDRNDVVVDVEGLSKHFGSLTVLSNISFSARQGELVSLVGPNGAGKTTLIRCLADGSERSEGNVRIAGRSIERLPADRIVGLGLGRKFQAASVFETLSVADCLRVARVRSERPSFITSSPVLSLPAAARAVVESSGLVERLGQEARFLSHGLKQALELAMVLALEPKVLLLDEPTAGLTRAERQGFAAILTALVVRDRLCVLIIEHDLDFVRQISSRIIVLHQGRIALDGPVAEVVDAPLVREIYTGRPPADASGVTA